MKRGKRLLGITALCVMVLAVALVPMPMSANDLEYLDVTGTYTYGGYAIKVSNLDGSRHQNIQCGTLTITTQDDQTISVATLTMPGKTVALTGLVGPGSRPYISLTGNDTKGTYVTINGRVRGDKISMRIEGYVTSDGEKGTDTTGTSAHSTVAAYSGAYSALLTASAVEGSVYVQFNYPRTTIRVKNLSNFTKGLGFWHNLESATTYGPQIELRFMASTCTDPGGAGHVDVTIMPTPYPMTGDGTWKEFALTSATTRAIYYGNDPTDGTEFGSAVEYTLGDIPALIDAEDAMKEGGDSAKDWKLSRIRIELWEAGTRTCYIDDVKINNKVYTLEPAKFTGSFTAKK